VSPLRMEDEEADIFITSAPSRFPASSNEGWVRVESSKNRLICVRPRSVVLFFSIWRLSSTNSSARSSKPIIPSRVRPSIPNKWRRLRTNDVFGAIVIKAMSIGGVYRCGKGAGRPDPQATKGRGVGRFRRIWPGNRAENRNPCLSLRVDHETAPASAGAERGSQIKAPCGDTTEANMRTILKYTAAVALTGAIALASAAPSEARYGRNAAAI